jgi:hypothetical protein
VETTLKLMGVDLTSKQIIWFLWFLQRVTTDLYTNIPVSSSNGITNLGNNGALSNEGIELSLRYDVLKALI